MLSVSPAELLLSVESCEDATLALDNHGLTPVAFDVRARHPDRYVVRPARGVVPASGRCVITVAIQQLLTLHTAPPAPAQQPFSPYGSRSPSPLRGQSPQQYHGALQYQQQHSSHLLPYLPSSAEAAPGSVADVVDDALLLRTCACPEAQGVDPSMWTGDFASSILESRAFGGGRGGAYGGATTTGLPGANDWTPPHLSSSSSLPPQQQGALPASVALSGVQALEVPLTLRWVAGAAAGQHRHGLAPPSPHEWTAPLSSHSPSTHGSPGPVSPPRAKNEVARSSLAPADAAGSRASRSLKGALEVANASDDEDEEYAGTATAATSSPVAGRSQESPRQQRKRLLPAGSRAGDTGAFGDDVVHTQSPSSFTHARSLAHERRLQTERDGQVSQRRRARRSMIFCALVVVVAMAAAVYASPKLSGKVRRATPPAVLRALETCKVKVVTFVSDLLDAGGESSGSAGARSRKAKPVAAATPAKLTKAKKRSPAKAAAPPPSTPPPHEEEAAADDTAVEPEEKGPTTSAAAEPAVAEASEDPLEMSDGAEIDAAAGDVSPDVDAVEEDSEDEAGDSDDQEHDGDA